MQYISSTQRQIERDSTIIPPHRHREIIQEFEIALCHELAEIHSERGLIQSTHSLSCNKNRGGAAVKESIIILFLTVGCSWI